MEERENNAAAGMDTAKQPTPRKRWLLRVLGKVSLVLLETVLLVAVALYGVMFVLAKGPSPTARDLFVRSVRETSAMGFLADIYFTPEEIAQIEAAKEIEEYSETDTSLIHVNVSTASEGPVADEWGLVDEDGDGIILQDVKGGGFSGYMLVVLDPSRVIMGSKPDQYGARGYTVEEMVKEFDAVAGVNAGGFYDPDGNGNGSIPDSLTVFGGEIYYENRGVGSGFVGLDENHILHVGKLTADEIRERNIQYGVCFGPVLISNGEVALAEGNVGGLNPRTAIGQRSDGAILLLVIDGRQAISIGATYQDLVDIFLEYGAVNACNLDGGSSSMMWYGDGYVNNCASVIGIRPVPTTFVVLKEGADGNG
ncbi:MAG: phosphodiester glycosidase family protein [Oscillospiraceae bacterium]|nr:phosphodiester glycosidase family protein [Oscillospiraceae bacterium]